MSNKFERIRAIVLSFPAPRTIGNSNDDREDYGFSCGTYSLAQTILKILDE